MKRIAVLILATAIFILSFNVRSFGQEGEKTKEAEVRGMVSVATAKNDKNEKNIAELEEKISKLEKDFKKKKEKLEEQISKEGDTKKKTKKEASLEKLSVKFEKEKSVLLKRIDSLKNVPVESQTQGAKSVIIVGSCGSLPTLKLTSLAIKNTIESHGLPDSCEYFPSQNVRLYITAPSEGLQSSACWVMGTFVFDGPAVMIFKYFDVNPPLVIVFNDMEVIASYSRSNFNEHERDRTLLEICPPGMMQMFRGEASAWYEMNFRGDQGTGYEDIFTNLFGAGGGMYRGGFEGSETAKRAQMLDDFKFRSIFLDKEFMDLPKKEEAIWLKISYSFNEIVGPIQEKITAGEARKLALEREGNRGDAEKIEKELRQLKEQRDKFFEPMVRADRSRESYDFANHSVRELIDFIAEKIPESERGKISDLAEEYKIAAGELRNAVEKIKQYLGHEFNPDILSEPIILVPPEIVVGVVAMAGVTYDFETQKPKLKLKIQESLQPMKRDGTIDKYAPVVKDLSVAGVFVDDLLQAGFIKAQTMCKHEEKRCIVSSVEGDGLLLISTLSFSDQNGVTYEEVDLLDMKEGGASWFPVSTPKNNAEVMKPLEPDKFLATFDFNDSEGHRLTVFVITNPTIRTSVLEKENGEKVELKHFPYPGVYAYEMTVVDALATDLKRREQRIPDIYFRVEPPPMPDSVEK